MNGLKVGFRYGVLSDPLEDQANEQGLTFGEKINFIHELKKSIDRCYFSVLTDSQYDSVIKKFNKIVIKNLKQKGDKL